MTTLSILEFAGVSALCILAPGPDILSVITYGISQGRRAGMSFGAGCAVGCLLHTFWLCVGLSALIAASATAFSVLKIAGAFYLFYLAFRAFRSSGLVRLNATAETGRLGSPVYFRRGFLANTLNPKVALFFIAFLPQFTSPGPPSVPWQFLLLGSAFALLSLVIFVAVGAFSAAVGDWLKSHSRAGAWLDRLAGTVFVLLGLRLLFTQWQQRT
jgi:threonine/homoserine/homoserine lactone efflux protein